MSMDGHLRKGIIFKAKILNFDLLDSKNENLFLKVQKLIKK